MSELEISIDYDPGALDAKADDIACAVLRQLGYSAQDVIGVAQGSNSMPIDSGHLKDSLTSEVVTDGDTITAHIGSSVKYAPYQEYGTGQKGADSPYRLQGAEYNLAGWTYFNEKSGHFVHTNGNPARGFVQDSLTAMSDQVRDEIAHAVQEACR